MLFAHLADCHIGGWREDKLKELNMQCFREAVKLIVLKNTDFVVLSGDLFNSALPQIDYIKEVTQELKTLKDRNIPVYIVAGSHDYSPSGKTMLDVLEKAGLIVNVMQFENDKLKFTVDAKTDVKIAGYLGKRGGLEIKDYDSLVFDHLEREEGYKIFLFHSLIEEFKPKGLEGVQGLNSNKLPKNFNYYAGGHVHYIFQKEMEKGVLTFPGALFPNNFKELEEWKCGGVYFVDENVKWEYVPIKLKDVECISVEVSGLSPEEVILKIKNEVKLREVKDKIVTLRIKGEILGKVGDIDFKEILEELSSAYFVLRNTAKLRSKVQEDINMKAGSVDEIENDILNEIESSIKIHENEIEFTKQLMNSLNKDKEEGEKVLDFEKRVIVDAEKVLNIEIKEN
ncbi:MAG: metallophosphoesterase [Nanoarchaeota archaeon]|nr:metallophosphoesterase [Nanoarchaeota archaeon]